MSHVKSDSEMIEAGLPGDDFVFEADALERANAAIARLRQTYVSEWAPAAIDEMYQTLAAAIRERTARRAQLEQLYRLAHDMKGQGGTFGFPVLTEIGEAMCRLTGDRSDFSDGEFALLRAHIDGARAILLANDDGEETARQLLAKLHALARSHFH